MNHFDCDHPWQMGPTELVSHALDHIDEDTEFGYRMAFLLLDIGVETIFKTFLELPNDVTQCDMSYGERKKASEGNFHELVQGIKISAINRLKGFDDLSAVEFYHDIRNRVYHKGNGITVPPEHSLEYSRIVIELLKRLLNVRLKPSTEWMLLSDRSLQRGAKTLQENVQQLRRQEYVFRSRVRYLAEKAEPLLNNLQVALHIRDWCMAIVSHESATERPRALPSEHYDWRDESSDLLTQHEHVFKTSPPMILPKNYKEQLREFDSLVKSLVTSLPNETQDLVEKYGLWDFIDIFLEIYRFEGRLRATLARDRGIHEVIQDEIDNMLDTAKSITDCLNLITLQRMYPEFEGIAEYMESLGRCEEYFSGVYSVPYAPMMTDSTIIREVLRDDQLHRAIFVTDILRKLESYNYKLHDLLTKE